MQPLEEHIDACPCYTLSEGVDEYLLMSGIDKKKYFAKYLVIAQRAWQKIFWNTLWVTKTVWQTLKKGEPYNYIDKPAGASRIFSVNTLDACGKLVPLFYNNQINVVSRPKVAACGCDACGCGGICEDVNGFQVVTKLLFTINGVDYFEKTWLKYCPNGDIWEYSQVPTKKYLSLTGDGGDYSSDYSNDYSTGDPPFANFEIVTQTSQRKICALSVKTCGCPEETPVNAGMIVNHCGGFLGPFHRGFRSHCDPFLADPAQAWYGQVKMSECGTRIYFIPPRTHCLDPCIQPLPHLPTFLQVSFQTDGKTVDAQNQIPDYAVFALFAGINWLSKLYNNKFPYAEKKQMEYQFNDEMNQIILYLNPFSLQTLGNIQDTPVPW